MLHADASILVECGTRHRLQADAQLRMSWFSLIAALLKFPSSTTAKKNAKVVIQFPSYL
jgi:hypothetical protein